MRAHRHSRGSDRGVSPLLGEALFVCIVLVLGGCLSYFIVRDRHTGGPAEYPLKTKLERNGDGNWTWTIEKGKADIDAALIIRSPHGWSKYAEPIWWPSWYFVFNDNNGDGYLDGGDIILLNQTADFVEPGWTVELIGSYNPSLTGPHTLPD